MLTDDQRWDSLVAMPLLQARLDRGHGVLFERAYVNVPMCCPARASILSGGFLPQKTGVLRNELPNGGIDAFVDTDTLATSAQSLGFRTAHIGKYLNGYRERGGGYVPPGWDTWVGLTDDEDWYSFGVVEGSSEGGGAELTLDGYMTDLLFDRARSFLAAGGPAFLYLPVFAPHFPATPDTPDVGAFGHLEPSGRATGEVDLSDKPVHIQQLANPTPSPLEQAALTEIFQAHHETLLSVDRNLEALLDDLESSGALERTVVVFASDNGLQWGEHGLQSKGWAYEESLRVPFVVWAPGAQGGVRDELVSVTCDLPATVRAIIGDERPSDGKDLWPLLYGEDPDWSEELFFEYDHNGGIAFAGVVTATRKYVLHATHEEEFYDLTVDPFEMESRHQDPAYAKEKDALARYVAARVPLWLSTDLMDLPVDEAFDIPLDVMGGVPPYVYTITGGAMPSGVTLTEDGRVQGSITLTQGAWDLDVRVTDSGTASVTGGPQVQDKSIRFRRNAPGQLAGAPFRLDTPAAWRQGSHVWVEVPAERDFDRLVWATDPDLESRREVAVGLEGPTTIELAVPVGSDVWLRSRARVSALSPVVHLPAD